MFILAQRTKIRVICQYILIWTFFLVIVFAPLGKLSMDLQITYFRAPDSDLGNGFEAELALGTGWCVAIGLTSIAESIMLIINKRSGFIVGVIACLFRQIYPAFLVLIKIVELIMKEDTLTVDLTVYAYLLTVCGVLSFINYLQIKRRQDQPTDVV